VYQNKIYCIGGYLGNSQFTGVNEVYDPAIDTWETKAPMPTARMDLHANVVNGKIYLIGGRSDLQYYYLSLNEVYDPSTDTWTTKSPAPYGITCGASAVAHDKIYFLSTASSLDLGPFPQIYDPKTDSWSTGNYGPTYGGWSTTAAATSPQDLSQKIIFFSESSTCIYFPANDSWVLGTPMPSARGFASVAVINDTFYLIGGIPAPFEGYIVITSSTNKNEQYTPNEFNPVSPDTKIYIRPNGRIEPSTANITTADGHVYTFTGNNSERMILERDNIIVNGNGYTLNGARDYGIVLFQRHNVTIANLTIAGFSTSGIGIESSTNNLIASNNILSNLNEGIRFYTGASNNTVTGNNIRYNKYMSGIHFYDDATNNVISSNNITDNCYGILSNDAPGNIITGNNIRFNNQHGIYFYNSSNNTITGNNIGNTEWEYGLCLVGNSNYNLISGNKIMNNEIGIVLEGSAGNSIYHNSFIGNRDAHATDDASNTWDNGYPSGGNYWSGYNGTDNNADGIGDTPYIIDENSRDNYPLMYPVDIVVIPEFPSWIILPLFMVVTLLAVIVCNEREKKKCQFIKKNSRKQLIHLNCY
jgi:parallel beta-helix repeat protein